ncbi:hypothetical protein H257_16079 [Aphanomyces astaci]|uniref:Dol-P-Glc:Glc(2)Man(9)GlcNAc(2)-PP-Dol alpha-1,2-glucosyltransferase n=1 Tax=Aphanomyces astaci TaxID=112090 RepID=W4FK11_APHAT|nr:hypothetical protein H257_16079 [Aphanomyces astaci]ETV67852.1 hypothetical protein H257_16079 [Aphanomyces astaci]|eukprot:XP_009842710.1 hypothetical protein H257_16079 [Aphanomyces astaci]
MPSAADAAVMVMVLSYVGVATLFSVHAPHAYMDEVFHFPQTEHYCEGRWGVWDPKITTFPGLYVVGTGFGSAVHHALSTFQVNVVAPSLCSLNVLRSINVLFNIGSLFLIVKLRCMKYAPDAITTGAVHGIVIALFPVHYFFSFLYYTDAGAVFFVLAMYFFAQRGRADRLRHGAMTMSHLVSAACGAVAVSFRQTNVIWVLFVLGIEIVHDLESTHDAALYGNSTETPASNALGLSTYISFASLLLKDSRRLAGLFWPHGSIVVAFGVFLVTNGSITVGDKTNHVATFHVGQLLYFSVVCATGLGVSCFWNPLEFVMTFAQHFRRRALVSMVLSSGFLIAIYSFSDVHPFILADNRHFTFYIWNRFFLKHRLMKMVPAPLYAYCLWLLWKHIRTASSPLRTSVYGLATALVLIPTPLVEPRYYIVPFVLYHLNADKQPLPQLVLTALCFGAVNALTIYVFLFKPFRWPDGSEARFMW